MSEDIIISKNDRSIPVGNRIIVSPIEPIEDQSNKLIFGSTEDNKLIFSIVVEIESKKLGVKEECPVKKGDLIGSAPYTGHKYKSEGKEYIVLSYSDIVIVRGGK